jgi:hypothetical protein
MSPVAADCASADSAPGELAALLVVGGVAEVVVVPAEAPLFEVDDELLDEDPQPATAIADASATAETESLFMGGRLAISPDDLLNGLRGPPAVVRTGAILARYACSQRF